MPEVEMASKKIIARLLREGWTMEGGTKHEKFAHPERPGMKIMIPRHRTLTPGVARSIAKAAGWIWKGERMAHYLALVDEADGAFGAVIPDCPGCTAMGDSFDDALANAIEALREWMADRVVDGFERVEPRSLRDLRADPALADVFSADTIVASVPLLLDAGRVVRANISVDAGLLDAIDSAAKARGLTRSSFLASAAREKIVAQR